MKVVILAGGLGTRLIEETNIKPKPMVEIGGYPILWHIMKIYSSYGFNDFIICLGHKGHVIKDFFSKYYLNNNDFTIKTNNDNITIHKRTSESWNISLIDTGSETMTGGRILKIKKYLNNEPFMLTYGDGVSNIDIKKLLDHHKSSKKYCTLTAVKPEAKFGVLDIDGNNLVTSFAEKNQEDIGWINGGFFVCEQEIFNYLRNDKEVWERYPLESLSGLNNLSAYKHEGFWKPMDTLKDKIELNKIWDSNNAPWKLW
jgi:glucose-1-phosphate cytidylyltransferase